MGLALAGRRFRSASLENSTFVCTTLLECLPAGALALILLIAGARGGGAVTLALAAGLLPRIWLTSRAVLTVAEGSPSTLLARAQGFGPWRVILRRILPLARRELLALAGVTVSMALKSDDSLETILDVPGLANWLGRPRWPETCHCSST